MHDLREDLFQFRWKLQAPTGFQELSNVALFILFVLPSIREWRMVDLPCESCRVTRHEALQQIGIHRFFSRIRIRPLGSKRHRARSSR